MGVDTINIEDVLKEHSAIGIVGNRHTGKSMMIMSLLEDLKVRLPDTNIYVFGIEDALLKKCDSCGFTIMESTMDILDLQIQDAVILIDEMALFFDTKTSSRQLDKLERFFDRIEHNNCKIIVSTAREGYFNKWMCGRVTAFLVKQVEYSALVNGSWLKERVKAIKSKSDYRLELDVSEFFVVTNRGDMITKRFTFDYDEEWDSKRFKKRLFV